MNQTMYDNLVELKEMLDEELAMTATWVAQDNTQTHITGIFCLHNQRTAVSNKGQQGAQLEVAHTEAYFSMAPETVDVSPGDQLIIDGTTYLVLPFVKGTFETAIPLKLTENKNHNWSGYVAPEA